VNRLISAVGGCLILSVAVATSAFAQSPRSKSDADIDSIGHRKISQETNFYSPEREKELGKRLASEIDNSSKFVTDTEITAFVDSVAQKIEQNSDKHMAIAVKLIDSDEARSFTLPAVAST